MKARMQCGAIAGMLREIEGNEHDPSGPASFEHRCQAAVDAIRELVGSAVIERTVFQRPELEGAVLRVSPRRSLNLEWAKGDIVQESDVQSMDIEDLRESASKFADYLAKMEESRT